MKKSPVKFSKAVKEFILDQMSKGLDVAQITSKYPDKVPARETIYRRSVSDPDFGDQMNQAYTVLLMHRLDELHRISSQTASEAYPDIDWREAEATLKRRIDESKFVLGKMAPVLSKRFDKTQKVEVSGDNLGAQIAIINYYQDDDKPKLLED